MIGEHTCHEGSMCRSTRALCVMANRSSAALPMKLVVIESPFAGEVEENVKYAIRCARDCLMRNESPYASHLFFTQRGLLDDTKPDDRKLGIEAGLAWARAAESAVVYVDRGISMGMRIGIARHQKEGRRIFVRTLDREVTQADIDDVMTGTNKEGTTP